MILHATNGQQLEIPIWIKNNAKWWSQGKIGDSDFVTGIQYLIQKGIMKIPISVTNATKSSVIPAWIKNNAGWWANGTISDNDFVSGLQYLIQSGIINVTVQNSSSVSDDLNRCNQLQTAADIETCKQQIELSIKLKNDIATATPYTLGPVTFYYVASNIDHTEENNTILTVHFVIENKGSGDVTMSCPRKDACNYVLSDGQNEIQYSTNTLVYGSLTLPPNDPRFLDWTFYEGLNYDPTKNYSFIIREPWGSGSIPLNLHR